MENLEKTENIVQFPVAPRTGVSMDQQDPIDPKADSKEPKKPLAHGLSPVKAMKVEYWHQGEQPVSRMHDVGPRNKHHAKRADQFGLLLLSCALLIVILVTVTLYLNDKKYLFSTSKVDETSTPMVDFYQGNHAFSKKVAEEKAAKQHGGYEVHGLTTVNDDLEVPLSDQMNSMTEKLKKMRSLQQSDELPPPAPDTGPKPDLSPLKPTKEMNFQSPLEFNNALPKGLQTNQ